MEKTGLLEPMPSSANYLCCRVKHNTGITALGLTESLLTRGFFIKDLTGKNGIPKNSEYICIAVQNPMDNDALIDELVKFRSTEVDK